MKMHNQSIILKVARKKFSAQGSRNIIACIAIALTTFMIYSIFSIGISYNKSIVKQGEQMQGTNADTLLLNPTSEQIEIIEASGLCASVGIGRQVAVLTDTQVPGINTGLFRWADQTSWERQIKPVLSEVIGEYPFQENEIMLPAWAAKKLGIRNLEPGQTIKLSFYYGGTEEGSFGRLSDTETKKFVVSGFYEDDSTEYIKNNAVIYVSDKFWQSTEYDKGEFKGAAYLTLKKNTEFSDLYNILTLSEEQDLSNLRNQGENNLAGIMGALGAVLVIMMCAGLIIYNVLYISVVQDIQFLGQLKTLGMTKRQLKKYLQYQICWLCLFGVPLGLGFAMLVSKLIVPLGVKAVAANTSNQIVSISFSPVILVGAALFSVLAVLLGSFKPLSVVGNVTAIGALRYTNIAVKGEEQKRKKDGIASMAIRNVFRNKKNAVIVFLSLFLGATIYLVIEGLLSGVSASALVDQYMKYDLEIKDEYSQEMITEDVIKQIAEIEGVKQLEIQRLVKSDGQNDGSGGWLKAEEVVNEYCSEKVEKFPQMESQLRWFKQDNMYRTEIIGIGEMEFLRLSKKYDLDINYNEFKEGNIGIWCYEDGLMDEVSEDAVTIYPEGLGAKAVIINKMASKAVSMREFTIGSYTGPNIVMSNEALQNIANTYISQADVLTQNSVYDEDVRLTINDIFQDAQEVTINSKYEKQDQLKGSFFMARVLGVALSLILFVIGIMNFINTIYASILSRKRELAILECIGMSKVQVKKMLIAEGVSYMIITSTLMFTIGTILYWGAFKVFSEMTGYAVFNYPVRAAVTMVFIMLGVSIGIPLLSYKGISEESAVEQLRKVE